jgi:hypothetical protein
MTLTPIEPATAAEIERVATRLANATVAYLVRLRDIADITTLTVGAHGFDFGVTVSHADMPHVLPRLADLTFEIEDEYGVHITALPVADTGAAAGTHPS